MRVESYSPMSFFYVSFVANSAGVRQSMSCLDCMYLRARLDHVNIRTRLNIHYTYKKSLL